MAGKIVTVAQQKGGAGKTTLAVHLGLAAHALGQRVVLADVDPQGSLTQWFELRREKLGEADGDIRVETVPGWRATSEIERLKRGFDLVVIDSPPHAEGDAKTVIRAADLVVIPIQPSPLDLWATQPTISIASAERKPALLVLNRVPPRSAVAEQMAGAAAQLGVDLAETHLGNRTGFAAAMAAGRGVSETAPRSSAASEMARLAREVLDRL